MKKGQKDYLKKFQEKIDDTARTFGRYYPKKEDRDSEWELLQKQTLKRNGKIHKSLSIGWSYFTFSYNGLNFKSGITLINEFNQGTYVKVKINLKSKFKLRIYFKDYSPFFYHNTSNLNTNFSKYSIGLKKIEIGNEKFDEKFIVKGNNEMDTINLLKHEIKNDLLDLECDNFYPLVNIDKKKFLLVALNRTYFEEDYDKIINLAIKFIDQLKYQGHMIFNID